MSAERVELGHGVAVQFVTYGEHARAGLIEHHPHSQTGDECGGSVMFDLPGIREAFPRHAVWQVEAMDPLTLSPSLQCGTCSHHGWIRGGRWVPA